MSVGETLVLIFSGERIPQKDSLNQAQSLLEAQCVQREHEAVYLERKQGRSTRPEKSVGISLMRSTSERSLKSCVWSSSSGSLFSSGQLFLLFSNIQPILGPFLIDVRIFCQDGFQRGGL